MSNQPPPPQPPSGGDGDPSWPATPPQPGDQPPSEPPAQPPTQSPTPVPNDPPAPPATQSGNDGGFGGQSMPPPPPGGPGGGAMPSGPYSPTDAMGYGWRQFVANLGPIIAAVLLLFVGLIIVSGVLTLVTGGFDAALSGDVTVATRLVNLVTQFLALLVGAAVIRAALAIVDGRQFNLGEFFRLEQMGQVVIAAILLSLATVIVAFIPILGFVGNLLISFFGQFIMFFILDDDMEAIPAITSSVGFVGAHISPLLVLMLLSFVAVLVGALLCGVGLLAALPVVVIAQAYTFRRLRGQPVAA